MTIALDEQFKRDCRSFCSDRPCGPHKRTGVTCPTCPEYDPVRTRILVVKLAALGDVLRTTSLLPAIKRAFPASHVAWLTAPGARDLFHRNDLVDEVLTTDDAVTSARLAVEEFDAVLCPDADPTAAVLAASARGRERRGFTLDAAGRVQPLGPGAARWFEMGLLDELKKANTETYQTLVAGVLELDPADVREPILVPGEADFVAAGRALGEVRGEGPLVGLNTGAGGRWLYKAWTVEHQMTFVQQITDRGCGVLLLGGPEERERHRTLMAAAAGRRVIDGGTENGYHRFAALVDSCDVLVTGDSFALHVGTARKVPVVALFGPTSSAEIELYGVGEKIVPRGLDCLCCYLPVCDVTPHCQARISPEVVAGAVQRQLDASRMRDPANG